MSFFSKIQSAVNFLTKPRISLLHVLSIGAIASTAGALYYYWTQEPPQPEPTPIEALVEKTSSWALNYAISIPIGLYAAYNKRWYMTKLNQLSEYSDHLHAKFADSWLGSKILPNWARPSIESEQVRTLKQFSQLMSKRALEPSHVVGTLPRNVDLDFLKRLSNKPLVFAYDEQQQEFVVFKLQAQEVSVPQVPSSDKTKLN